MLLSRDDVPRLKRSTSPPPFDMLGLVYRQNEVGMKSLAFSTNARNAGKKNRRRSMDSSFPQRDYSFAGNVGLLLLFVKGKVEGVMRNLLPHDNFSESKSYSSFPSGRATQYFVNGCKILTNHSALPGGGRGAAGNLSVVVVRGRGGNYRGYYQAEEKNGTSGVMAPRKDAAHAKAVRCEVKGRPEKSATLQKREDDEARQYEEKWACANGGPTFSSWAMIPEIRQMEKTETAPSKSAFKDPAKSCVGFGDQVFVGRRDDTRYLAQTSKPLLRGSNRSGIVTGIGGEEQYPAADTGETIPRITGRS
ncbi:hypothetical protein EDD85DRAFT_968670 [Armillaria nabsnona]|nr:hypothetical protein EDD85DRAFT_1005985 [Armillaria nabsnona]KAK0234363.1 hypothetical protein EDD85DRAFT_968670 [Armillaria nabsnona]